jgi:hypothetical protein
VKATDQLAAHNLAVAQAIAAERERCAKIADEHVSLLIGNAAADPSGDAMEMAKSIAEAIRNPEIV